MKKYLSQAQTAEMFAVKGVTIRHWRDKGILKEGVHWSRIGNNYYFDPEELAKLLPGQASIPLIE